MASLAIPNQISHALIVLGIPFVSTRFIKSTITPNSFQDGSLFLQITAFAAALGRSLRRLSAKTSGLLHQQVVVISTYVKIRIAQIVGCEDLLDLLP